MKQPLIFLLPVILALSACGQKPKGISETEVFSTTALSEGEKPVKFRLETVATGLEVPWGLAFLPDGRILVTERPGRVRLIENGKLKPEPIFKVPDVEPSGESGLMDIALHPKFNENNFIYLAYAYRGDGKAVKVVRYRFDGATLVEPKIILENMPAAQFHAGTRARFGPDGKLYITVGDATDWNLAQRTDSLGGKTLRLNDDGTVPSDNPFVKDKSVRPEIYSLGHRNAQGLAWSADGLMFQTEHGPSSFEGRGGGADEFNLVEAGKNYGWPEIYGTMAKEGMVAPLIEYTPACAPGSLLIYKGDKFPALKGSAIFGCLRGARLIRVKLDGRKIVGQENLLEGLLSRIREVGESPDGFIYFATSNRDGRGSPDRADDRIFKLVPVP
ncbi:MAG: PQQ-dependent sugar dehydrogenase [Acidobacteria bacterium]|nr:PQQ-dependent sugar dehydrogenase [Acidobacteriota bacterium]